MGNEKITWTNEQRRLGDLIPWPRNPRQINKDQAKRLADSFTTFGQVETIAVSESGDIYNGHQRLNVLMEKHGPDYVVDVRVASRPLSEKEREKLTVYLHKGAAGEWDFDALSGFDLDDLINWGFDESELRIGGYNSKGEDPGAQTDRTTELQEKWNTRVGQLWEMGDHRLIIGDCTILLTLERLMQGEKANLLFTSPPYWVGKEYEEQKSEAEIDDFIGACVRAWTDYVGVDNGRIVINSGTAAIHRIEKKRRVEVLPLIDKWQREMRQRGWIVRHFRIWAKSGDFPARIAAKTDMVDQRWEHLATFENEDYTYLETFWSPAGDQRGGEKIGTKWAQQGVWADIPGDRSAGGLHCAAFPLELPLRHLMLYTKCGEVVLDPFSGSGTTIIACEKESRKGRGVELDPGYAAASLERWSIMTGQKPVLLCNGEQHG